MKNWVLLVFVYAIFNGLFQCSKKKSVEKNSIYEVLAYFSSIAFLITMFFSNNVFEIELKYLIFILLKSTVVVLSWLFGVYAIDKMPVSLFGVLNLSRIIFSIIMSVIFLGESITTNTFIGMIIVILGLVLVNIVSNKKEKKETSFKVLIILLISCLLNSISAIMDKKILGDITSSQLQFWFLLFISIIYWLILLIKKEKTNFKSIKKNYWILIAAICLAVGDRILYIANQIPESQVSIMTIIKQLSAIEVIILGKVLFNERNITKKLLCSILIILGIILTVI